MRSRFAVLPTAVLLACLAACGHRSPLEATSGERTKSVSAQGRSAGRWESFYPLEPGNHWFYRGRTETRTIAGGIAGEVERTEWTDDLWLGRAHSINGVRYVAEFDRQSFTGNYLVRQDASGLYDIFEFLAPPETSPHATRPALEEEMASRPGGPMLAEQVRLPYPLHVGARWTRFPADTFVVEAIEPVQLRMGRFMGYRVRHLMGIPNPSGVWSWYGNLGLLRTLRHAEFDLRDGSRKIIDSLMELDSLVTDSTFLRSPLAAPQ